MNRPSRHTFIAGMLALTMLMGASLACNRGNRQNNTAPTTDAPAVQAPATQPPQATAAPTEQQPTSVPATQEPPAATAQPTEAPTLATPTATEGTSEADALGAQVDDLLNQLDAANNSADDLGDANP